MESLPIQFTSRSKKTSNITLNVGGSQNFEDLPSTEGLPNVEILSKVENSPTVEAPPNFETLSEICSEVKEMLECLGALMQQSEYQTVYQSLGPVCDEIEAVVDKGEPGDTMALHLPQMLVLGQPKCGKSSLINELLGMHVVEQSQLFRITPLLTKLRYSSKPNTHQGLPESPESDKATLTDISLPSVVSLGLASEFVKQSGLEFLDSPGSPESPPVNSWAGLSMAPTVIAYVIDASSGITRDVEEDIRQIQFYYTSSQLLFVINKMDASAEVASAAGISQDEAEAVMRERVLAGLQRLGCSVALPDQPRRVFCLSCRKLRALRRERLQRQASGDECSFESGLRSWQENLQNLRHSIVNSLGQRLWQLASKFSDGLDDTAELLSVLDPQLDDLDESKKQAWENIVNLLSALSKDSTKDATALDERMTAHLLQRRPEIINAVLEQVAKTQAETVPEIQRLAFEQQMQHCQEFAVAELNPRFRRIDDILSALSTYPDPLPSTPVRQSDRIFTIQEILTFEQVEKSGTAGNAPSKMFLKKQEWQKKVVKRFMKSGNMSTALKLVTERLASRLLNAEREVKTASSQAHLQVSEFQDQLRLKRQGLFNQRHRALKLWLRLHSVITAAQLLPRFHWSRRVCIAVGAQGSVVYRVAESTADGTEGRSMAVKKIVLNDEQFSDMAFGLRCNCLSKSDSVLPIQGLVIKQLSSQPAIWKLHLWMDIMMELSLQHQLPYLLEHKSPTERLGILLKTAQSLMQVQSEMRHHGNLCLSNVFLCKDGESVKLSDIGQSRANQRNQQLTLVNRLCGSATDAGQESFDVHCLGLILRAMFCGKVSSSTDTSVIEDVTKLTEDCVHQLPESRPKVSEVADRLKRILGLEEIPLPS